MVTVLSEFVCHHVVEEEKEMMRESRAFDLDLKTLGEQMTARKA